MVGSFLCLQHDVYWAGRLLSHCFGKSPPTCMAYKFGLNSRVQRNIIPSNGLFTHLAYIRTGYGVRYAYTRVSMFVLTLQLLALALSVVAVSRTSPPSGALVVRAGTTTSGEYATLLAAVAALPNDSSSRSIFIYPGTYQGQVNIQRTGPTIVCLGV